MKALVNTKSIAGLELREVPNAQIGISDVLIRYHLSYRRSRLQPGARVALI
jgi:hypothetical protein